MPPPLAYLITWTTHGTWLHGDARGSIDRHAPRGPGVPPLAPNSVREQFEREELTGPPRALDRAMRDLVECVIRDHCEHRGWSLHALNARTNHVHVVVTAMVPPEKVMGECKAWASRRLREHGLITRGKVWTRHGSTRYLNDEASVEVAIRYVLERQE